MAKPYDVDLDEMARLLKTLQGKDSSKYKAIYEDLMNLNEKLISDGVPQLSQDEYEKARKTRKAPKSAYMLFLDAHGRDLCGLDLPPDKFHAHLRAQWKNLDDKKRNLYHEQARAEVDQFNTALTEWPSSMSNRTWGGNDTDSQSITLDTDA